MPIVPDGSRSFQLEHLSGRESERASHEAYGRVIAHAVALFPRVFTEQEHLFGLDHTANTLMALLDELQRLQRHHRHCGADSTKDAEVRVFQARDGA